MDDGFNAAWALAELQSELSSAEIPENMATVLDPSLTAGGPHWDLMRYEDDNDLSLSLSPPKGSFSRE